MSASNWAICPRCVDRARIKQANLLREAAAAYGNVPADEYDRLLNRAQEPVDEDSFQTFREDYEFYGASEGTVTAVYGGTCQVCTLSLSFQHIHPFYERELRPEGVGA